MALVHGQPMGGEPLTCHSPLSSGCLHLCLLTDKDKLYMISEFVSGGSVMPDEKYVWCGVVEERGLRSGCLVRFVGCT